MSRFKLFWLGLLAAVVAVGALSATPASAEGCGAGDGGAKNLFCTSPGNVEIHELAVVGEGELSRLVGTIGGVEARIHCTDDVIVGTIHLLGLATGEVDFLGCTVEKPAGCAVQGDGTHPGLVLASVHIQLLSSLMEGELLGLVTGSGTGGEAEEFAKLELTGGGCAFAGSYTVTGLQIVELPEGGKGKVGHEIVAKKANSKLKLGGNTASFSSAAEVHLDSNEEWLIMLGTPEGCSDGGVKNLFCTSSGDVEIHELAVVSESGLSILAATVSGAEMKIHCKDDLFDGTLHLLGLATGEANFLGCTVEKPTGCAVQGDSAHPGLVLAFVHIQLLSNLMEGELLGLATGNRTGGEPEEFAKLEITGGGCAVTGTFTITGLQIVELPEWGSGRVEHEIVAKKANSKLKFGGNTASLSSTAKVHLDSNEEWLIMLGT